MRSRQFVCGLLAIGAAVLVTAPAPARAQTLMNEVPAPARGLEVVEHLGETLPLDLEFINSDGRTVRLGDYFAGSRPGFSGKPAIVAMVYFRCPIACSTVMSKLTESLNQLDFTVGKDFNTLVFDFKEEETTIEAAAAKVRYTSGYPRARDPETVAGWQFHTGTPEATQKLADAIGFPYRRMDDGEYSHPICIFVVSPKGTISRYVYGYNYEPTMVKMALLEASEGKIARTIGDRFVHLCYRYDPKAGTYTLRAFRLMQLGGIVTVLAVGSLIVGLRVNEALRRRRSGAARPGADSPKAGLAAEGAP
jgi:protein SCO1/2